MWGWLVLFLGMMFHTRSGKPKRKPSKHRTFYKQGHMREEMDALDSLHEGLNVSEKVDKRK